MPVDAVLISRRSGQDLLTVPAPIGKEPVAVAQSIGQSFGTFNSVSGSVAGTTTVVSVVPGKSVVITDILISSKKKAGSSLTLRFSDGTNAVTIFAPDTVQAEVNFAAPLVGLWRGWLAANIEVVTVADVVFTVAIGYYKIVGGDDFVSWDAQR